MVNPENLAGHEQRFHALRAAKPDHEADNLYVGGGDPIHIGYREKELISRHRPLEGAFVVDVGCGIGRLTRYVAREPVRGYLGTDIMPEILSRARETASGRPDFRFELVRGCRIPAPDASADIVCGFSLITHLLDEQVFAYFREARRALSEGGVAAFSFIDFVHHKSMFLDFAANHETRHDVLKFFEKSTLRMFAQETGFSVIEIMDGGAHVPGSGGSALLDGRPAPASISIGQSVIFMRAG